MLNKTDDNLRDHADDNTRDDDIAPLSKGVGTEYTDVERREGDQSNEFKYAANGNHHTPNTHDKEPHDNGTNLHMKVKDVNTSDEDEAKTKTAEDLEETEHPGLPVDRGWAWWILFASSLDMFIVVGVIKCFGIFFVQSQQRFKATSAATSIIFTMQGVAFSLVSMTVMTIGQAMSSRTSIMIGTIMLVTAYVTSGYVTDIKIAYFTYGILVGASHALIQPHVLAMVSTYFRKYRGAANNITNIGQSLGGLVLAPFFTKMFEIYGFTGTFILSAGVHLNIFVVAMLLRPVEFYTKRKRNKTKANRDILNATESNMIVKNRRFKESNGKTNNANGTPDVNYHLIKDGVLLRKGLRSRCKSESTSEHKTDISMDSIFNPNMAHFASSDVIGFSSSLTNIALATKGSKHDICEYNAEQKDISGKGSITGRGTCGKFLDMLDVKLLTNPAFLYLLFCNGLLSLGCGTVGVFIPPHAVDMGIDNDRVAWTVSAECIVDIISRFVFGYIADKKIMPSSAIVAIASVILGLGTFSIFLCQTFMAIMILSVFIGFLQGVYWGLFVVLIFEVLPFEKMKSAIGFILFTQGLFFTVALPFTGFLRDYTGRYYASFSFIGSVLVVGGVMGYFIPHVHRWNQNRLARKQRAMDAEHHDV